MFLFLTPREEDLNNVKGVAEGYRRLAARHTGSVARVPALSIEETHKFIVEQLRQADLVRVDYQ